MSCCEIFGCWTYVPLPRAAHEIALAREVVERGTDGEARDAEVDAELPLGGDCGADAEPLDQLHHLLPRGALLRHLRWVSDRFHRAATIEALAEVVNAIAFTSDEMRYRLHDRSGGRDRPRQRQQGLLRRSDRRRRRFADHRQRRVPRPRRPSGCGKSTLLRMIAGLEEATDGTISIGERDVTELPPRAPRRRDGLPELRALPAHDRAREPRLRAKVRQDAEAARSPSASHGSPQLLGLEQLLDRKPAALSGGQRQRVAMGRAIVREPKAFLMDEPLSNLDAKLRVEHARAARRAPRAGSRRRRSTSRTTRSRR